MNGNRPLAAGMSAVTGRTRLECRICWYVYDPALGDELAQVQPGTPFCDLPDDWRCPQCDAEQNGFLPFSE